MRALLKSWLSFQRRQTVMFAFMLAAFLGYAMFTASRSEIEAFPELTNVQVQLITQLPGKASEEVERLVTIPLEVATTGLPGLINERSISTFGLSVITLTFDDGVPTRQARVDVAQRIGDADLPEGVKPALSPESTPVGEIFRYTLEGPIPVDELKLIEDWRLEREFKSIPGVADVVSFGGPTRTVEVRLDLTRLKALGLAVSAVAQALGQNHANAGGALITHGEESYVVRSLGLYERPEDLEAAVIATQKGVPIRVRDVGSVQLAHKPRLGLVGRNDADDVVEGIVLLREGSDSLKTCEAIRERIARLNAGQLPPGVLVRPYYDRTDLISMSSHTVFHNIIFGVFLVCLLLLPGFGIPNWPMTAAVAAIIPFSLLTVFLVLHLLGFVPNLISLGAVDFGIIIETAIFSAEAVIGAWAASATEEIAEQKSEEAFRAVLGPALLCAVLLVIAFLPILSLQRVEGRIFRPLGVTLLAALAGGQLGTLLFIPIGRRFCPRGSLPANRADAYINRLLVWCEKKGRLLATAPRLRLIAGGGLAFCVLSLAAFTGREFLPNLNEGALYIRASGPATISLDAATALAAQIRARLKQIPEVIDAVSQIGRPDDGTDVNGFDNIEIDVTMKPPSEWKSASSIEGFDAIAQAKLADLEGVDFNFSQPIKDNVDEAISGVKGELVVKIFGNNLEQLQKTGDDVAQVLRAVPGAEDVGAERLLGQPELRFSMNRDVLSRYGLRVTDAEDVLESALQGKTAAKLTDDEGRTVDIVVRPAIPESPPVDVLTALPILSPDGAKVTLGEVSVPALKEGVGRIYRETGERRIAVKCSVRNRAVVDFVNEANRRIQEKVSLPPKFRLQWSGSFENAERAGRQLMLLVPLCLAAMLVLLYSWLRRWRTVGLLLWELPFAAVGGLALLRIFSLNFSVSAAAGGIVLMGVTFLTGLMYIEGAEEHGDAWAGLRAKGRSILLSNGVAIIGLVPAAFSRGIGSETARPFAVMILGGLLSSLFLSLVLLPALVAWEKTRAESEKPIA